MLFVRTIAIAAFAVLASGCASTSSPVLGGGNISYGDSKAVELITNEFGSTDLQSIAESMTRSLAQSGVLQGRPVIQVYDVKNKTSEYIDTREITTSSQDPADENRHRSFRQRQHRYRAAKSTSSSSRIRAACTSSPRSAEPAT